MKLHSLLEVNLSMASFTLSFGQLRTCGVPFLTRIHLLSLRDATFLSFPNIQSDDETTVLRESYNSYKISKRL